ncbi:MAG: aldehyde ferredoxin oxidoreductase C-terminal domain-containing protein [Actinomycetota bacterium]|nr:aldehyde ferredoxin oxidoreductase C-terminal domain-containing protein [Actinomycetota bacterium]
METGHLLDIVCLAQYLDIKKWPKMAYLMDIRNRAGLVGLAGIGSTFLMSVAHDLELLSQEDTPGVDIGRQEEKYAALIDLICERRGIGEAAAQGWLKLAEAVPGFDLEVFMGLEKGALCFYDMRDTGLDVRSFHQMVNPRGSHHPQCHWVISAPEVNYETLCEAFLKTGASPQDAERIFSGGDMRVGRMTSHIQDVGMVMDSLEARVLYPLINLPVHMENLARIYPPPPGRRPAPPTSSCAGSAGITCSN